MLLVGNMQKGIEYMSACAIEFTFCLLKTLTTIRGKFEVTGYKSSCFLSSAGKNYR
jgi:hypothetical protein